MPDLADASWGVNVTNYLIALATGSLQKAGGAFTLTSEVDFGGVFGLKALYFKSKTALPASAGVLQLAVSDKIAFRNNANSADVVLGLSASDRFQVGGTDVVLASDTIPITGGGTGQITKTAAYDALSPNTTKGDIEAFNGTNNVRLAAGADGTVLSYDSTQATGLKAIAPLTNPMTAVGDTIYGGASGIVTRLAPNTTTVKKFLAQTGTGSAGQAPAWTDLAGNVPGSSGAAATAAGQIGEVISFASGADFAGSTTLGTYTDVTGSSIPLTAGLWSISFTIPLLATWSSGTGYVVVSGGIRDSSNNLILMLPAIICNSSGTNVGTASGTISVRLSSSTTYKLSFAGFVGALSPVIGVLTAKGTFGNITLTAKRDG